VGRRAQQWLLALGLLGGLSAHAASPVWAVRGAHNTVYIAGSMHLLPPQDATLPPGFERAYRDSARLVMEMDLGALDPGAMSEWMMAHGTLPVGTQLRGVLGDSRYERVRTAAQQLGFPVVALDHLTPWMVGIELTELAYANAGYDSDTGVEEQLLRRAQAEGKPTAGLETLEEELGGLAALSPEDQVHMLEQTLEDIRDIQPQMREVLGAWRAGDADRLGQLLADEYRSFPSLFEPLVTVRNARWLPQVEALLRAQDNSFVVVGALHVAGPGGLLERLRRDGFSVRQLD